MPHAARTFRIFRQLHLQRSQGRAQRPAAATSSRDCGALLSRHGCRFQAIDLRWGVSQEASLDQQTSAHLSGGGSRRCQAGVAPAQLRRAAGRPLRLATAPGGYAAQEFAAIERTLRPSGLFAHSEGMQTRAQSHSLTVTSSTQCGASGVRTAATGRQVLRTGRPGAQRSRAPSEGLSGQWRG